ncbi:hypothetical protein Q8A73_009714 [Channa argus]|nr:hypothetical protein Q8A73_009714 [Channa argus]
METTRLHENFPSSSVSEECTTFQLRHTLLLLRGPGILVPRGRCPLCIRAITRMTAASVAAEAKTKMRKSSGWRVRWIYARWCADDRVGVIGHLLRMREKPASPQVFVLLSRCGQSAPCSDHRAAGDRDQRAEPNRTEQNQNKKCANKEGKRRYDSANCATTFSLVCLLVSWMLERNSCQLPFRNRISSTTCHVTHLLFLSEPASIPAPSSACSLDYCSIFIFRHHVVATITSVQTPLKELVSLSASSDATIAQTFPEKEEEGATFGEN